MNVVSGYSCCIIEDEGLNLFPRLAYELEDLLC